MRPSPGWDCPVNHPGLVFLALAALAQAAETRVPWRAGEPQCDGRLQDAEWAEAAGVKAGATVRLLVQRHEGTVSLGVRATNEWPGYVDLFLQTEEGVVHNLHASMQLGERIVRGRDWDDRTPATVWGRGEGWLANTQRLRPERAKDDPPTRASFVPYDGHEFVISRTRFTGKVWRLRVEVRDFRGQHADIVFPSGSSRHDPAGWWQLRLE